MSVTFFFNKLKQPNARPLFGLHVLLLYDHIYLYFRHNLFCARQVRYRTVAAPTLLLLYFGAGFDFYNSTCCLPEMQRKAFSMLTSKIAFFVVPVTACRCAPDSFEDSIKKIFNLPPGGSFLRTYYTPPCRHFAVFPFAMFRDIFLQ